MLYYRLNKYSNLSNPIFLGETRLNFTNLDKRRICTAPSDKKENENRISNEEEIWVQTNYANKAVGVSVALSWFSDIFD